MKCLFYLFGNVKLGPMLSVTPKSPPFWGKLVLHVKQDKL